MQWNKPFQAYCFLFSSPPHFLLSSCPSCQSTNSVKALKHWGAWWRWTLVSSDGVASSQMVGVSASVIFPCTKKSRSSFLAPASLVVPVKGP